MYMCTHYIVAILHVVISLWLDEMQAGFYGLS